MNILLQKISEPHSAQFSAGDDRGLKEIRETRLKNSTVEFLTVELSSGM
jgi:hypothetical protein